LTGIFKAFDKMGIAFEDILYKIYEEQEAIVNVNSKPTTAKIQRGVPLSLALIKQ